MSLLCNPKVCTHTGHIFHALKITITATVRNFRRISGKFKAVGICTGGNYT